MRTSRHRIVRLLAAAFALAASLPAAGMEVRGHLSDHEGRPLAGIEMAARSGGQTLAVAHSGADGAFAFSLPADRPWTITADDDQILEQGLFCVPSIGWDPVRGDLITLPIGLPGPIDPVRISLVAIPTRPRLDIDYAPDRGPGLSVEFPVPASALVLRPRTYRIEASADLARWEPVDRILLEGSTPVRLLRRDTDAGRHYRAVLVEEDADAFVTLSGTLSAEGGQPLAGVRIAFEALDDPSLATREVTSDPEGRYALPVPAGRWRGLPDEDDLLERGFFCEPGFVFDPGAAIPPGAPRPGTVLLVSRPTGIELVAVPILPELALVTGEGDPARLRASLPAIAAAEIPAGTRLAFTLERSIDLATWETLGTLKVGPGAAATRDLPGEAGGEWYYRATFAGADSDEAGPAGLPLVDFLDIEFDPGR